jgi:hypothetical protein
MKRLLMVIGVAWLMFSGLFIVSGRLDTWVTPAWLIYQAVRFTVFLNQYPFAYVVLVILLLLPGIAFLLLAERVK